MQRRPLKAVIFDLDGTLLDRDSSLGAFVVAQYRNLGSRLTPAPFEDFQRRFLELDDHGSVWKDKVYQTLVLEFGITKIGWQQGVPD